MAYVLCLKMSALYTWASGWSHMLCTFFFFGFTNSEDGGDALGWTGILVQNVRMSTHVCEDEKQQMRKNKTRTVLEFL